MQSTLTATETDPHDIFVIEPDVVLAARGDQANQAAAKEKSADPAAFVHDILNRPSAAEANAASGVVAAASVPTVDTTFRAAAGNTVATDTTEVPGIEVPRDIHPLSERPAWSRWASRAIVGLVFAIGSGAAAEGWNHYGDKAKAMIVAWAPPFMLTSPFTLTSSQPAEKPAVAAQPAAPDASSAAATDQAAAQPAATAQPAQDAAPEGIAPATAAATPASMAQDIATMGQQIEQLKATIEQLKAGQEQMAQQMAQQNARIVAAKAAQAKISDPNLHPKVSALSQPATATVRKPRPPYSPALAAAALAQSRGSAAPPAYRPPPQPAPVSSQYAPQAQIDRADGDPVDRPPMPLR